MKQTIAALAPEGQESNLGTSRRVTSHRPLHGRGQMAAVGPARA